MNTLAINIHQKHGQLRGTIKLSRDPLFNMECLLEATAEFAKSVHKPHHEVLADMYNYVRTQHNSNTQPKEK